MKTTDKMPIKEAIKLARAQAMKDTLPMCEMDRKVVRIRPDGSKYTETITMSGCFFVGTKKFAKTCASYL